MSRFITSIGKFVGLLIDVQDTDRDAIVVITGDTGEGKSVFLWILLRELARERKRFFNPVRELIYERGEFNLAVDEMEEMSGIGIDEAVGVFYARDYHDDEQIALLKKLDRIRYRRLVLGMAIPSLFHIDKHIRDARVRYWVYIKKRKGKGKGGYAHAYIFEKEKNPFNSDPWNLGYNRKLYSRGRIDRSHNYIGEIIYNDIPEEEYRIYNRIKDVKRKIAEKSEWKRAFKRKRKKGQTGEKYDRRLNA